ncbi:MAG: DUF1295 domain-containing protein [Myxococcales bacterium]|nr:DUF1295 domain-containing protein [Myxococcales bacterium]
MDPERFTLLLWIELIAALVIVPILRFISAPYGRHARRGFGPTIPARLGWFVMEAPALGCFLYMFFQTCEHSAAALLLAGLWVAHYGYRSLVYPLRLRGGGRMPALVAGMAFVFNLCNGSINGYAIAALAPHLSAPSWLFDPRFLVGVAMFACGMWINHDADAALRRLRAPGETGYKIPRGGLYERVSCPNYLGELIEWTGFCLAAWTPAAAVFVVFTAANLIPRALAHHRWYRERFPDYPPRRRAIFPGLL